MNTVDSVAHYDSYTPSHFSEGKSIPCKAVYAAIARLAEHHDVVPVRAAAAPVPRHGACGDMLG